MKKYEEVVFLKEGLENHEYVLHIKKSFLNAIDEKSKINLDILSIRGFSGKYTRHFYNNLLELPSVRYLEIGTWRGSSFFSAIYNNNVTATCIDNWSEFGGPKKEFLYDLDKYKGKNIVKYIEGDSFKIDVNGLGKFNIYLYDGSHKGDAHYKALTHYIGAMDDIFIYVVDDWNWEPYVRIPTMKAIADLKLEVLYKHEFFCELNVAETWWNGICVFLLKK